MKASACALLAIVGLASRIGAQAIEGITYTIEWQFPEITVGGTNFGTVYA